MTKNILKIEFILLLFIIILGFLLRSHNVNTWPRTGATFDEFAWTWVGMNLIQQGVPVSWSPHPQYENAKSVNYDKVHFRLVTPWLEHPPLFGLVAGGVALLNGVEEMQSLKVDNIRPLALALGVLSIALVFYLSSLLYDRKVALFAAILYATIPTIVVGSRIVQNENFFIPLWLSSLIFITKYLKNKNRTFFYYASLICGLLILAKIPWVAATGSIFLILLYLKKFKDSFLFLIIPIICFLIFVVYGFYYDGKLFVELMKLQTARYDLGFTSIFALFQKPYLIDRFYLDGWIYFGWFAFILFLTDIKKHFVLILALVSYFFIFLTGIPDEPSHGWYRYPFYPFLVISIALFIKEYFAKNWVLTFLFLVLLIMYFFFTQLL